MNKKFLTALLLGAFTIASTSTLVSCKDYDDDINGLQAEIDQKTTEIANLQTALNNAKVELQGEIEKLQGQLTEEKARAQKAEEDLTKKLTAVEGDLAAEITRAKAAEKGLTDDLAAAVGRIANLETRIKAAEDAIVRIDDTIDKLNKKVDANKAEIDAALAEINTTLATLATKDELKKVKEDLQAAIDAEKERAMKAEKKLTDDLDAEKLARETAIAAEKQAREEAVKKLEDQDEVLAAADEALSKRIKTIEDDYLKAADKAELKGLIEAEETARKTEIAAVRAELAQAVIDLRNELKAYTDAQVKIVDEKLDATKAALEKAIADEAEAREAADKKEAQARKDGLEALKAQFDAQVISLQNQINQLNSKLTSEVTRLEGLIAEAKKAGDDAMAYAKNLENTKVQDALNRIAAVEGELPGIKDRITAVENLLKPGGSIYDSIKAIEASLKDDGAIGSRIKELENQAAQVENKINTAIQNELQAGTGKIATAIATAVNAEKDARETAMTKLQNEVITPLSEKVNKIETALNALSNELWDALRALVLEPASYYHGIQAIDVTTLNFNGLTGLLAADPNADQAADAGTPDATATSVAPEIVANYHLNPSTAKVSDKVEKYQFLPLDRKFAKTLATNDLPITSVATANGMLTVKAKVNDAAQIKNIAADEQVTVIALNYIDNKENGKDTTITSDYAALKASFISNFRINRAFQPDYKEDGTGVKDPGYVALAGLHNHVYTTAAAAIAANADYEIPYNNAGIDLSELFNTHVAYQDGSSDAAIDANAKDGTLKTQKGISYKFELIGYHVGGKSESAWAIINEDGVTFRPQPAGTDDKQQAWGAEQKKTEIGHMPLVRITLTEAISGKVVAVGYVKFRITTANPNLTEHFTNTKAYSLGCNDDVVLTYNNASVPTDADTYASITLITDTVKQELNIEKAVFEAKYTLEMDGTEAKQYAKDNNGVFSDAAEKNGEVTVEADGSLTWTVKNNRAYQYFNGASKPKTMTTFVRYKANDITDPESPLEFIYVQFIWTPKEINITPTAEFKKDNTARIDAYWYAKNEGTAGTGFDDIHGNVEVVGTGTCQFVFDVKNTLVGNIAQITKDPKYNGAGGVNENMKAHFEFIKPDVTTVKGESGLEYTLTVSNDGTQLQAANPTIDGGDPKTVATIVKTDVVVPSDPADEAGKITFADNASAKDILNYAAHSELGDGQTLTGKVAVKVTTCDPVGATLNVTDGTFNVKFLRPVTITNGNATFTDAMTGGDTKPVSLTFTDWRNYEFVSHTASEGINYWEYYDVIDIVADMDGITTTLNGGTLGVTPLNSITTKLNFTYLKPGQTDPMVDPTPAEIKTAIQSAPHDYGYLTYKNNGLTVGGFKIRVPIEVTYKWGKIKSYIDCSIGNTIGNVKKQ